MAPQSNDAIYCHLPSRKKIRNFKKNFFQNFGYVTFFTWLTPNFMQDFRKTNELSPRYLRRTTDRGDNIGPLLIDQGPKFAPVVECSYLETCILKQTFSVVLICNLLLWRRFGNASKNENHILDTLPTVLVFLSLIHRIIVHYLSMCLSSTLRMVWKEHFLNKLR